MTVYIIDNSNHRLAGQWVSDCIPQCGDKVIVGRDDSRNLLTKNDISQLIITGSEHSIFEDESWILDQLGVIVKCAEEKTPVLGICFGYQLIVRGFYGKDALKRRSKLEVGWGKVTLSAHPVFEGLPDVIQPYLFHFDEAIIDKLPDFDVIARSEQCPCHAIIHHQLPVLGVQFHPEITAMEGRESYMRESGSLMAFGVDIDDVLGTLEDEDNSYYPRIIDNFLEFYK